MILYFGEMVSLNSLKTLIIVTGVSVSLPVDRSISSKTEVRFYKLKKMSADNKLNNKLNFTLLLWIMYFFFLGRAKMQSAKKSQI